MPFQLFLLFIFLIGLILLRNGWLVDLFNFLFLRYILLRLFRISLSLLFIVWLLLPILYNFNLLCRHFHIDMKHYCFCLKSRLSNTVIVLHGSHNQIIFTIHIVDFVLVIVESSRFKDCNFNGILCNSSILESKGM